MNSYLKQVAIVLFTVLTVSGQAMASIKMPFPAAPDDLQGAFSGTQYIGKEKLSVEVLIHGGAMPGSFIITLIRESRWAQVFYAELLDQKTVGLISLGLSNDQSDVDDKMPPSALMRITVDSRNVIQSIDMTPQDGNSLLSGPVSLTKMSRSLQVSDVLAQGEYVGRDRADRSDKLKIYYSGHDVLVSGSAKRIGLSNDYSLSFDLTGVGALRARNFEDHFQKRESSIISALLLPVKVGRDSGAVLIRVSFDGKMAPATVLRLK